MSYILQTARSTLYIMICIFIFSLYGKEPQPPIEIMTSEIVNMKAIYGAQYFDIVKIIDLVCAQNPFVKFVASMSVYAENYSTLVVSRLAFAFLPTYKELLIIIVLSFICSKSIKSKITLNFKEPFMYTMLVMFFKRISIYFILFIFFQLYFPADTILPIAGILLCIFIGFKIGVIL